MNEKTYSYNGSSIYRKTLSFQEKFNYCKQNEGTVAEPKGSLEILCFRTDGGLVIKLEKLMF